MMYQALDIIYPKIKLITKEKRESKPHKIRAAMITTPTTIRVVWVVSVLLGQTTFRISVADCFIVWKAIDPNSVNLKTNRPNENKTINTFNLRFKLHKINKLIKDLKTSNEVASTKTTALAAISNLGAINAEQTLSLLQNKLQKNANGEVVVLNGGVEQNLTTYLTSLKNPGSGWEHHFKPSSAAGMGAKPSPIANAGGGQPNPWKTGNITQQMLISEQDPQLAAVLKQEAQTK